MIEIEEDTNIWKGRPCLWMEEFILLKYPYYSKGSMDSMKTLSKFQRCSSQKQKTKC